MNYKIKYQKGGFNYDSSSSSDSELDTLSSEKEYKTQQLKIPIMYFDFFMNTFNKTNKIINNNSILTKTNAAQQIVVDPKCIRTDEDIDDAVAEWIDDQTAGTKKYCHISDWDTSRVTEMQELFGNQETFNEDISKWNVSNVTDMEGMFYGAKSFNQPLNSWDVCKVTNMGHMFSGAKSFNKPLNSWDVSSVNNMTDMFSGAKSFNQNIDSWNVKATVDKNNMFNGSAISPLPSWYP